MSHRRTPATTPEWSGPSGPHGVGARAAHGGMPRCDRLGNAQLRPTRECARAATRNTRTWSERRWGEPGTRAGTALGSNENTCATRRPWRTPTRWHDFGVDNLLI